MSDRARAVLGRREVATVASCVLWAACAGAPGDGPTLSCASSQISQVVAQVGTYTSFAGGCTSFPSNASTTDTAEYIVVAQSGGGFPGLTAAYVLQNSTSGVVSARTPLPMAQRVAERPSAVAQFDRYLRQLARGERQINVPPAARARLTASPAIRRAATPIVGALRTFRVCATVNPPCTDYLNDFKMVTAHVRAVTPHFALYVDDSAPSDGLDSAGVDSLAQQFETRVYPTDTAAFGRESDIDSNHVVIALMTGVVNKMIPASQCFTSGYVAGFFFAPDLDPMGAALYNDGEIFYTMVGDTLGLLSCPHTASAVKRVLFSTFLHEFQHMINFNWHVRVNKGAAEDIWLDEGLSKYAEELGGRTYLAQGDTANFNRYTLDDLNNAYLYLEAPGTHYLLAPTDQDLPSVGAGWMFVRYLVDQSGGDYAVTRSLVQSPLTGTKNVQAQMGGPFSSIAAQWALANWVSDLPGFTPNAALRYTSWQFRTAFAGLRARDTTGRYTLNFPLVPAVVIGSQVAVSGTLHGGSGDYVRVLQPPGAPSFTLLFTGPSPPSLTAVDAQLTVMRLR